MNRRIVIFSGFNRARFSPLKGKQGQPHKCITEEWIANRYKIWEKYTWKSLLNQTHTDWVYCLCCSLDAKKITDRYFGDIKDKRFHLTYSGTQQEVDVMKKLAKGYDEMVNVRIDSDDMYHPMAIMELHNALYDESRRWFLWQKGYGYQYSPGKDIGIMKRYWPGHGSGPFFAHRYKAEGWLNTKIIKECQHTWVIKYMPKILSPGKILVGVYDNNTSTHFKAGYFHDEVTGDEKDRILRNFKII